MTEVQVILHPDPAGGYWAEVPSLAGCVSGGPTKDEALENIWSALAECVRCYRSAGRPLPWLTDPPPAAAGADVHSVPALWDEPWPDFGAEEEGDTPEEDDEMSIPIEDLLAEYGVDVRKRKE